MTPYRHVEPIAPYATQDDPFWWCGRCEEGEHDLHAEVYRDIFGEAAGCICPHHA